MHIRNLYAYSDNCRAVLREILIPHSDVFRTEFRTLSGFCSVHRLAAHIVGAEERWIEWRLQGREVISYEERAAQSVQDMFDDWQRVRDRTYAFIETLDEEAYGRVVHLRLGGPASGWEWEGDLTVEQILFHIVNHETHHRAQISMALQQMGIDPPNFDFVFHHG
jgi:uncharacterized damage-inducible protein DinB